jgi:hypothetical protein
MLFIITIPLLLSFSFGVLSGLLISGIILVFIYFRRIFSSKKRRRLLYSFIALILVTFLVAYFFFPDNLVFARVRNIFTGADTSARGRTYESFILANRVAETKSYLWGIGPGQLNLVGREIFVKFYSYSRIPQTIRIPNACAETIACFGYIGLSIRLGLQLLLFFLTKTYRNPYRLWLFLFVFIYQFTGSYITNVAEYIIWILAFSNIFPEFSKASMNADNIVK